MKFNYQFPTRAVKHWDTWIGPHDLSDVAVEAESAGFDLVSTTDHPFPSQAWIDGGGHHSFDPFVALAFMAAATTRIRLLTFIVVAGYRNPYLIAKAASSLDVLSHGRLVMGMGAGYQREEFTVLGAAFTDRGERFDAAIGAAKRAWTGQTVVSQDRHFPAHGHTMLPAPAQHGGPPIWIGGNGSAAMRRVATVADGWLPFEQPAAMAKITSTPELAAADLAEKIDGIRSARLRHGREPDFEVCFTPRPGRDADETADELLQVIPYYEQVGITHLSIDSTARSVDACLREIYLYGRRLMAG